MTNPMTPSPDSLTEERLRLKWVLRYDRTQHKLRLFRFLWQRGLVGDGKGYSAKLAVSLAPRLFKWTPEYFGWRLSVLGVQLHHVKAYGGHFV